MIAEITGIVDDLFVSVGFFVAGFVIGFVSYTVFKK